MIVSTARTRLDQALANERHTLLLLCGSRQSQAGIIHAALKTMGLAPWRRYFLITNLTLLTDQEKQTWFDNAQSDRYALLGGRILPKTVAVSGPITDLLRADGKPGARKIRAAYNQGGRQ
jgi:hypothetical protein